MKRSRLRTRKIGYNLIKISPIIRQQKMLDIQSFTLYFIVLYPFLSQKQAA